MTRTLLAPSAIDPADLAARSGDPRVAGLDVLHVPYTYFPGPVGGTEVYVANLARSLKELGVRSAVAAPGQADSVGEYDEVAVYRFAGSPRPGLEAAYGAPDEASATSFSAVLEAIKPKLVHIHARTAAVSERLVEVAHDAGAKVVFTYHTPTVSCMRGTMLRMGLAPCDGRLDVRRCARCVLQGHGVPELLSRALAALPQAAGEAFGSAGLGGGAFTALRMSAMVGRSHLRFQTLMHKADHVVAVCDWVAEVLRTNDVPSSKITLCRQGVDLRPEATTARTLGPVFDGPLRIGYFGRIDPTKGVDLLIEALRRLPDASVNLQIFGVAQAGSETYATSLRRAAGSDSRITMQSSLPPDQVRGAMANCDLVAVPSRWLETGPMVVLEAFAAGVPVLGARLGGIAELVTDGVDGVLVTPDDPLAMAAAIGALASDRDAIARLRNGIRPPRTTDDVAREMASLYGKVLGRVGG